MIRTLIQWKGNNWQKSLLFIWSWILPISIISIVALKIETSLARIDFIESFTLASGTGILLSLALLPLNVGIESWKWQYILKTVDHKTLWQIIKIILAGKSLNVITPIGLGDGFSKYVGLNQKARKNIYAALAIDRISQFSPTIVFGFISALFLLNNGFEFSYSPALWVILILGVLLISAGVFFFQNKDRSTRYLNIFKEMNLESMSMIALASFSRYLVFITQFYLIFWALDSQLSNVVIVLGVAWIFLIKTILPSMSVLGDLVKRGISATLFFSFFTEDIGLVLVASFLVWCINIVLPAVLGVFFVSELKKSF